MTKQNQTKMPLCNYNETIPKVNSIYVRSSSSRASPSPLAALVLNEATSPVGNFLASLMIYTHFHSSQNALQLTMSALQV